MDEIPFYKRVRSLLFNEPTTTQATVDAATAPGNNKIVYLGNAPFRKIKIHLVDTWEGSTIKHIERLAHDITELEFTNDKQAAQIKKLEQDVARLQTSNAAMQALNITNPVQWLNINLTSENNKLRKQVKELRSENGTLLKQCGSLHYEQNKLKEEYRTLNANHTSLKIVQEKYTGLLKEYAALNNGYNCLLQLNTDLRNENSKLNDEYHKLANEQHELRKGYKNTNNEYHSLRTENNKLRNAYNQLQKEYKLLRDCPPKTLAPEQTGLSGEGNEYDTLFNKPAIKEKDQQQAQLENEKVLHYSNKLADLIMDYSEVESGRISTSQKVAAATVAFAQLRKVQKKIGTEIAILLGNMNGYVNMDPNPTITGEECYARLMNNTKKIEKGLHKLRSLHDEANNI